MIIVEDGRSKVKEVHMKVSLSFTTISNSPLIFDSN